MQYTSTITQKGQATIPAPIRKKLGITKNSQIIFTVKRDSVEISPAPDFFSLKGSVKSKKKFDIEAMDQAVSSLVASEYGKKHT